MSSGKRQFREDPTSYKRTGIPCGNPKRYQSHGVMRMVRDSTGYRDQRLGMPVEDEIATEAGLQIKELSKRQLDTRITLHGQLSNKKQFTEGVHCRPVATSVSGTHTLEQFRSLADHDSQIDELRLCGLTEEEIQIHLHCADKTQGNTSSDISTDQSCQRLRQRSGGYGADPATIEARQRSISEKLMHHASRLAIPDTFSGSRPLGRHALQLERVLTQGRNPAPCLVSSEVVHDDDGIIRDIVNKTVELTENWVDVVGGTVTMENVIIGPEPFQGESVPNGPRSLQGDVDSIPEDVIRADRLSVDEIRHMERFRSYDPGEPSQTIYLKNLSPKVTDCDLVALFIRFQVTEVKIIFKLMTGRMKGQAFVTFHDVKTATAALELVNGYQLKGRPIIIEYSKQRKADNKTTT